MALAARLQLRQTQSLTLTPQLLQSIRLLQFTSAELETFIDGIIETNPLIERAESAPAEPGPTEAPGEEWTAQAMAERLDSSLENVFPDDPGTSERIAPDLSAQWRSAAGISGPRAAEDAFDIADVTAAPVSLRDHVGAQIALSFADPVDLHLAREIADSLDEAGYARFSASELSLRLGVDPARVEAVLERCQGFEPSGLFARDLAECLAIQLRQRDRFDPAMAALVGHLDLLARRDFAALKRVCGVEEDDLLAMAAEIRALDPKPGAGFAGGIADAIVPDVLVNPAPDGSWLVELNPDALPRVLIDRDYFSRVSSSRASDADRAFMDDCLQTANWLVRSLDQRARTILKVASEIVRQQDAFLVGGVAHLKPLNLRTVAEAIAMHESTVSRVTANKFIATPRGVFEMRYFFTAALASAEGGESHSAEAVRHRIRRLIEDEPAGDVLSDDALVELLRGEGVEIARRTVAKYRESLSIASSVSRRREKRAAAAAAAAG
ncbi:MAG: RNA polymerase factor sigma-54 [Rhizobiaceae bacterium]